MMLGGLTRGLRAGRHSVRHASASAAAAKSKHFSVRMTDSGVAIITYDWPDNKVNALNAEVGAELQQTLQDIVSVVPWCCRLHHVPSCFAAHCAPRLVCGGGSPNTSRGGQGQCVSVWASPHITILLLQRHLFLPHTHTSTRAAL